MEQATRGICFGRHNTKEVSVVFAAQKYDWFFCFDWRQGKVLIIVFLAPAFMQVVASDGSAESDVVVGNQELRREQPPACREYIEVVKPKSFS